MKRTKNINGKSKGQNNLSIYPENMVTCFKVPGGQKQEEIWAQLMEKINHASESNSLKRKSISLGFVVKIAASLTFIMSISAYFLYENSWVNIHTQRGQHIQTVLPDGSQVQLNAETNLKYNKLSWYFVHEVSMRGEALFMVKKGSRFSVYSPLAKTLVLGTIFNVFDRGDNVKVSCYEGLVLVKPKTNREKFVLKPNQELCSGNGSLVEKTFGAEKNQASWTKGEFFYSNSPLKEVFDELQRQFNVEVQYLASQTRFYTGVFSNKDLGDALQMICIPMQLDFLRARHLPHR